MGKAQFVFFGCLVIVFVIWFLSMLIFYDAIFNVPRITWFEFFRCSIGFLVVSIFGFLFYEGAGYLLMNPTMFYFEVLLIDKYGSFYKHIFASSMFETHSIILIGFMVASIGLYIGVRIQNVMPRSRFFIIIFSGLFFIVSYLYIIS